LVTEVIGINGCFAYDGVIVSFRHFKSIIFFKYKVKESPRSEVELIHLSSDSCIRRLYSYISI